MAINLEKIVNSGLADVLAAKEWYIKLSVFAEGLSQLQLIIILAAALVLLAFLVYRKLGPTAMAALVFFYLIAYVLYQFDFLTVYETRELEKTRHLRQIEEELERK